jgi:hypothetical protein
MTKPYAATPEHCANHWLMRPVAATGSRASGLSRAAPLGIR